MSNGQVIKGLKFKAIQINIRLFYNHTQNYYIPLQDSIKVKALNNHRHNLLELIKHTPPHISYRPTLAHIDIVYTRNII